MAILTKKYIALLLQLLLTAGMVLACQAQPAANRLKVNHTPWTQLLQKHVEANGNVSYKGFSKDKAKLDVYLGQLSKGIPDEKTWSREEQLAYWINAYNAFTVKLIVDNYPVKSIKDLNGKLAVPLVNTIWDKKFFKLGGVAYSLNNIEHDILRKKFEEPRIHFAINCASISCPVLRREAYTAAKLETQLTDQTRLFLNDTTKNRITLENPKLSSIFNWFSSDFTKDGSLISFVNQYSKVKINSNAKITYLDYDWSLNE